MRATRARDVITEPQARDRCSRPSPPRHAEPRNRVTPRPRPAPRSDALLVSGHPADHGTPPGSRWLTPAGVATGSRNHDNVPIALRAFDNAGRPGAVLAGAEAYLNDLPDAELNLLHTGHFAPEEDGDLIAERIRDFLGRHIR